MNTTVIPMQLSATVANEVQVQWEYYTPEILVSIREGIAQAARGEGRDLEESDLTVDDDE
jgi:hypothetical protein